MRVGDTQVSIRCRCRHKSSYKCSTRVAHDCILSTCYPVLISAENRLAISSCKRMGTCMCTKRIQVQLSRAIPVHNMLRSLPRSLYSIPVQEIKCASGGYRGVTEVEPLPLMDFQTMRQLTFVSPFQTENDNRVAKTC